MIIDKKNESALKNKIKYSEEFIVWINEIADKINKIIKKSEITDDFKQEHLLNFNVDNFSNLEKNLYSDHAEIENDFIYAIPNIMVYIIKKIPKHSKKIILSLGKYYEHITGSRIGNIDWNSIDSIPRVFTDNMKKRELSDDFEKYMFGRIHLERTRRLGNKKEDDFYTYLLKSSLFRKLYEKNLPKLENLKKAEFIKNLVNDSLKSISEIEGVSDKQWMDFLNKGSLEVLEERKKIVATYKNLSSELMIETKEDFEKEIKKLDNFIDEIGVLLKENNYDDNKVTLEKQALCEENRKEIMRLKLLKDYASLNFFEDKTFVNIMQSVSRLKMNVSKDGNNDGIPKNFLENRNFTCFSGTWLVASLLLKSGIKKENIYLIDLAVGESNLIQKHVALLVKKSNGDYIKLDYTISNFEKIRPSLNGEVDNLLSRLDLGVEESPFDEYDGNSKHVEKYKYIYGLGRIGGLLKLEDGISVMYLISLAGTYLEKKNYKKMIEILNIAKSIDRYNYNIHELMGIANYNLGNIDLSIQNFEASKKYLSFSPYSLFFLGKIYFDEGDYKKAKSHLNPFISNSKQTWGVDKNYIFKAESYLKIIEDSKKKSDNSEKLKIEEIINDFLYLNINDIEKEYFLHNKTRRKKILKLMKNKVNNDLQLDNRDKSWYVSIIPFLINVEFEKGTGVITNKEVSIKIDF